MSGSLSAYWWIIIPLGLAFLALIFSLERRGSKVKKIFPQNYIDGLRAIIAGDENGAFVKLKQAVAEDTDNVDAYLKLGDLFRRKGRLEKAIQIHRELLLRKKISQDMALMIRHSLAEDYILADKYSQALELLEPLAKNAAFRTWALEKQLEIFEKTKQWDKAFNVRKNLLSSKDESYRLAVYRYLNGLDLFNDGEYHKARLAFKDALKLDKKFAPAYIMIAESYLAEKRNSDAVEFYKKLAKNAPEETYRVTEKMEQALFELGHFSDVEKIYREVLQCCPDEFNIIKALAGIEEKKGNIGGAIETLNRAFDEDNPDISIAIELAKLHLTEKQPEKATAVLKVIQDKWQSPKYAYACPHCGRTAARREIICPNCKRVGPYNKL